MAKGAIVRASQEAVDAIGKLRECDEREVYAAFGVGGKVALQVSFEQATESWAILADGCPVGIFGVTAFGKERGCPWMLANDDIKLVWGFLLRQTREYVFGPMMNGYRLLINYIHAENKVSIRWLEWAGFCVGSARKYGAKGELFRPFWVRRV